MTRAVLGLVARGYSVEQVIDALLTRGLRSDERGTPLCFVISEEGRDEPPYLVPEGTDLMAGECPDLSSSEAPADGDDGAEPRESAEESGSTAAPVDVGPLEWSGEMAPTNLSEPWSPDGPANVLVTRTPGTNELEIVLGASITATSTVTGCTSIEDKTFEGTGTFVSDDRIEFPGTYVNDRGGTCTDDPVDQELEYVLTVEITETGLALPNWEGFSFELPGVPVRIDE